MNNRMHRFGAVAMIFAGVSACSSDDGGPTGPGGTPEPAAYDLTVDLQRLYVRGDCEDKDGNPGEFNWLVTVSVTSSLNARIGSNGQYPSENTVIKYHDDFVDELGLDLTISDIPAAVADDAVITFQAIEWDPDGPDADMNDVEVTNQVLPGHDGGTHFAGIGFTSACALRLQYVPNWTPR